MGTTTKMAIPYPEATGLVKDGWEDMKDIATQVDAKSGLVLLNTTSFSAVSSQNLQYFSTNYDNYKIIAKFTAFSGNPDIRARMSASGVDATTGDYNFGSRYIRSTGAGGDIQGNGQTSLLFGYGVTTNPQDTQIDINIISPFLAERTGFIINSVNNDATSWLAIAGSGAYRVSTSYNGITIYPSTGTMTGVASVFGYNKG